MKIHLRMLTPSNQNRLLIPYLVEKKFRQFFALLPFCMNYYSPTLYKEVLECYDYETRNPTIYGNVIRGEVEFAQSSEECGSDQQGDENHL